MNNNRKVLKGDIESIQYYASILLQAFGGVKNGKDKTDSMLVVETHSIPIMCNPSHPKSVLLKVESDHRDNTGSMHLDSGEELLEWQAKTKSLCNSCDKIKSLIGILVCSEMLEPSSTNVKSCKKYRFKKHES